MGAGIAGSRSKLAHSLDQACNTTKGAVTGRTLIQAHVRVSKALFDNLHDLWNDVLDFRIL